jgi:sialate O-acetylesterase
VGYYFGRDLHRSQKIPIGLINSSVGGTGARLWLPTAALQASPVLAPLLEEDLKLKIMFCTKIRDTSPEAAQWLKDVEAARAANKPLPLLPPLPKQDHYAGYLYNGMIAPLTKFPIKGVLWYQGESNTTSFPVARQYRPLLTALIDSWRAAWGIGDFPFYIVQLPSFGTTVAEHPWAETRESQRLVSRSVPKSGLVVTVDLGEANTWHPVNKRDVGTRAALLARAKTYGEDVVGTGPEYESMKVVGNEIVLTFAKHSGPLVAKGDALEHFTVAGADKKFHPATARIEGDTVIVSSDAVPAPVAVRYAWAGNPEGANLFNAAGLPASPFTTAPPD